MNKIFKEPSQKERLDFFDSLRAIAIFPVVIIHYHSPSMPGGFLGVYVFFTISGFLVAMSLENTKWSKFYIRRFFRIYGPLSALLFLWAICEINIGAYTNKKIYSNSDILLTIINNLLVLERPNWEGYTISVLWTLHAEIWFYIFAPVIFLPMILKKKL